MKLLRKEGKVSTSEGKIVDEQGRSCCCGGNYVALLFSECCNGDPQIWVALSILNAPSQALACPVIRYQGKCYSKTTGLGTVKTLADLESQGIAYINEFTNGDGCLETNYSDTSNPCFYARRDELCPTCPDRCCNVVGIPNCDDPQNQIYPKTCFLGNKYRISSSMKRSITRGGYRGAAYQVFDVPVPVGYPQETKCFGIYRDIWYLDLIETQLDATIERMPDPNFPDLPGACAEKIEIHNARLTQRIYMFSYQFERFTNTYIDPDTGFDTGYLTTASKMYFENPVVFDNTTVRQFNTIEEIAGSGYANLFLFQPETRCVSLRNTNDQAGHPECCNGSSRDIQTTEFTRYDRQASLRSSIGCLQGNFLRVINERMADCRGSLDPAPTLERFVEDELSGQYSVSVLDTTYCDLPVNGPIAADPLTPAPLLFNGMSEMQDPTNGRKLSGLLRSGCHSCRTGIGI